MAPATNALRAAGFEERSRPRPPVLCRVYPTTLRASSAYPGHGTRAPAFNPWLWRHLRGRETECVPRYTNDHTRLIRLSTTYTMRSTDLKTPS